MDAEATFTEFVNRAASMGRACTDIEERRDFLARLHRGLVAEMQQKGLGLEPAVKRADFIIEAVLRAIMAETEKESDAA